MDGMFDDELSLVGDLFGRLLFWVLRYTCLLELSLIEICFSEEIVFLGEGLDLIKGIELLLIEKVIEKKVREKERENRKGWFYFNFFFWWKRGRE